MLIKPRTAIDNGWLSCPNDIDWDKHIQPNAIDFPVNRLFHINESNHFFISEDKKEMRGGDEFIATLDGRYGCDTWTLQPHTSYDAMSDFYMNIPDGIAVDIIIRSTFNRNGVFITSGLYDSGFQGNMGFAIHNNSGYVYLVPGTRIGQIRFWESDSEGKYAGQYNTENGAHWNE